MRKNNIFLLVLLAMLMQGCVYNSINLVDLIGKDMVFKKGLTGINVTGVERVVILRESNSGNATKDPIPYPDLKICVEK